MSKNSQSINISEATIEISSDEEMPNTFTKNGNKSGNSSFARLAVKRESSAPSFLDDLSDIDYGPRTDDKFKAKKVKQAMISSALEIRSLNLPNIFPPHATVNSSSEFYKTPCSHPLKNANQDKSTLTRNELIETPKYDHAFTAIKSEDLERRSSNWTLPYRQHINNNSNQLDKQVDGSYQFNYIGEEAMNKYTK